MDDHTMRVPPHSIEAEQSVLGACFLDAEAFDRIDGACGEDDFYRYDHRLIFRAIAAMVAANEPVDVVTVSEYLKSIDGLDDAGGLAYLGTMAKDTPSAANVLGYAKIVRELSIKRGILAAGVDIGDLVWSANEESAEELLSRAEAVVLSVADTSSSADSFVSSKDALKASLTAIDHLSKHQGQLLGLSTGYEGIDRMTQGLQKGDLVIVAGRPSMGKTTFAMNIADDAASSGKKVAVFSMEMPTEQLTQRRMASAGRVNFTKIRTAKLDDNDWPRLATAVKRLSAGDLSIDDSPALTNTTIAARARRVKRELGGLDLIVLDYLQLMQGSGASGDNRNNEVSSFSRGLKALAKELDVPIIAISQLNRSLEQRPNKRPVMSDLRESGAIEQDADLIFFIYRDEVYNPDTEFKGQAEVIIAKQRNGPIGTERLTFLGQYCRFEDFAPDASSGGWG